MYKTTYLCISTSRWFALDEEIDIYAYVIFRGLVTQAMVEQFIRGWKLGHDFLNVFFYHEP